MVKKLAFLILGVILLTLLLAPVAMAATPQDIYNDFLAHGKLTHTYSQADLNAYLNNATIHGYGDKTVLDQLDDLVNTLVSRSSFPFTGFQMMLAGIVAVVLVGGGFALRRFSRQS